MNFLFWSVDFILNVDNRSLTFIQKMCNGTMTQTKSLNNYKILKGRTSMKTKTPEWGTKHTQIAKKLEGHFESPKQKMYTSYSNYMKVLHAKTS